MGIHDRDYARPGSGSRPSSFRMGGFKWSVNAWLIAICVAVFAIDGLLPPMVVPVHPIPVIPVGTPDGGRVLTPIPTTATVDPIDQGRMRIPGREDLFAGRANVWVEVTADGGESSAYVERSVKGSRSLPPRFALIAKSIADDGSVERAIGTMTVRDDAGNTSREDVLLLEEVRVGGPLFGWGYFSTSTALLTMDDHVGLRGFEFWRFITFQFLHANLSHLLFNMMGLYFFGALVEQYLGSKRYLAFYLICGMMGAGSYLILNLAGWSVYSLTGTDLPVLLVNDPGTPLVGASAGVFGVVIASAFLMPNARVLLFFVIPMKLATLAYGLVAVALFSVIFGTTNAGGEAAHIGGAMAGYWLIRRPHLLHGFFDFLGRYDPTSRSGAAYRAGRLRSSSATADADIDRILAKIHENGLQSLTSREKKLLREASKR